MEVPQLIGATIDARLAQLTHRTTHLRDCGLRLAMPFQRLKMIRMRVKPRIRLAVVPVTAQRGV
jgi:hypothetical protein